MEKHRGTLDEIPGAGRVTTALAHHWHLVLAAAAVGLALGVSFVAVSCLSMQDLREVAGYAAESAREALEIFERAHPADGRPRDAVGAAWTFARGGKRGKALRDTAWAALKAARAADTAAASDPARAAMYAASAAYLHPLADAHQVKHILGAAAHAARAAELAAGDDRGVGADRIEKARRRATPAVVDVLGRYPVAPPGGGRVGELLRDLDVALRVTGSEPTPRTDT